MAMNDRSLQTTWPPVLRVASLTSIITGQMYTKNIRLRMWQNKKNTSNHGSSIEGGRTTNVTNITNILNKTMNASVRRMKQICWHKHAEWLCQIRLIRRTPAFIGSVQSDLFYLLNSLLKQKNMFLLANKQPFFYEIGVTSNTCGSFIEGWNNKCNKCNECNA